MNSACLVLLAISLGQTPEQMKWTVDSVEREATVYRPSKQTSDAAPIVFGFHGHGGNAQRAAKMFRIHQLWPEAIVVYPQGLRTRTRRDPEGQRSGWQPGASMNEDRDLKFVDAMLKGLGEKYPLDKRRVFATGHSNGGGFTYLLWSQRPDVFTAFAPSAAGARAQTFQSLEPRPLMHIAGEKDAIVPFEMQKVVIEQVKKANQCETVGEKWAEGCTRYSSKAGAPLITFIHPGDHKYPSQAPELIVRFFQEFPPSAAKTSQ